MKKDTDKKLGTWFSGPHKTKDVNSILQTLNDRAGYKKFSAKKIDTIKIDTIVVGKLWQFYEHKK